MHALAFINANVHTKFEVPSSTHFKDMIEAPKFKNGSRDPDHAPFRGGL